MNRQLLRSASAFVLAMAFAAPARAETADEVLKKLDKAMNDFVDLTLDSTMTVFEPGQSTGRDVGFTSVTKGPKRLVRFTAPGDVKGMGFLVESADQMYALLPAFGNRVRRLGTHVKNQSFMGSDIAYEEMSSTEYGSIYVPKLAGEEDGAWVLELALKPGKEAEFPRLKLWVDKKTAQAVRIECFDDKGTNVKTEKREGFKLDQGSTTHYTADTMTFIDHRRNDHKTVLRNNKAVANQKVGDDVFTQRNLQRSQ
jgi:outer membrane lipoprotein-sorting protein